MGGSPLLPKHRNIHKTPVFAPSARKLAASSANTSAVRATLRDLGFLSIPEPELVYAERKTKWVYEGTYLQF